MPALWSPRTIRSKSVFSSSTTKTVSGATVKIIPHEHNAHLVRHYEPLLYSSAENGSPAQQFAPSPFYGKGDCYLPPMLRCCTPADSRFGKIETIHKACFEAVSVCPHFGVCLRPAGSCRMACVTSGTPR